MDKVWYYHIRGTEHRLTSNGKNKYVVTEANIREAILHIIKKETLNEGQGMILESNLIDQLETFLYDTNRRPTAVTLGINNGMAGISWCSFQDNFCKKVGRDIALERLSGRPVVLNNP